MKWYLVSGSSIRSEGWMDVDFNKRSKEKEVVLKNWNIPVEPETPEIKTAKSSYTPVLPSNMTSTVIEKTPVPSAIATSSTGESTGLGTFIGVDFGREAHFNSHNDGDAQPLLQIEPVYPIEALASEKEGWVS